MLPELMLKPVLYAGVFLAIMSIVDTLAYGVRTAGVLTKKLAISLALFNILVIVSRLSNMFQAPILGNLPDKVNQGTYSPDQVLTALRIDLLFVVGGVIIGALLTRSFIAISQRGINVMEEKGSLPPVAWYGLKRCWRVLSYLRAPLPKDFGRYLNPKNIPLSFLVFNVFVTCFYSIGVMSTVMAASWDHNLATTAALLSGIVNGIATILLFVIVDPPAAVVIDQCISGKREVKDAKVMNVYLVLTRLAGTILAIAALPLMSRYVLAAAQWVDRFFAANQGAV